jgi:ankyrin repeat protein
MYASLNEYLDIIKLLLEKGAEVNKVNFFNYTALAYATLSGNMEIIKLLVDHGSDIDIADCPGWTPLMHASRMNKIELVEYFITSGANIRHKDIIGRNALSISRLHRNIPVLRYLSAITIQRVYLSYKNCKKAKKILRAKRIDVIRMFNLPHELTYLMSEYL